VSLAGCVDDLAGFCERSTNNERGAVGCDVTPGEPEQLAEPASGPQRNGVQRPSRLVSRGFQQALGLSRR